MQKHQMNESGSALIGAIIFSTIITIAGLTSLRIISSGSSMHNRELETIRSFWANESALRIAYRYLSIQNTNDLDVNGTLPVKINGYTPSIKISALGSNKYDIEVKTKIKNSNQYNISKVSGLKINNFGSWTLYEAQGATQGSSGSLFDFLSKLSSSWLTMKIDGNYYVGGTLDLFPAMSTDRVTGTVTTATTYTDNSYAKPWNHGVNVVADEYVNLFDQEGWNTPGHEDWFKKRLPKYVNLADKIDHSVIEPSAMTGKEFSNVKEVELRNSNIRLTYNDNKHKDYPISQFDNYNNVLIFDSEIKVKGTLDGQLTLVTKNGNDIVIEDDIHYANEQLDPSKDNFSDDALALISDADIVTRQNITFSNRNLKDYSVYAGLYAPNGAYQSKVTILGHDLDDLNPFIQMLFRWVDLTYDFNLHGNILQKKHGMNLAVNENYFQDLRYVNNSIVPPGVPYAKVNDYEVAQGWRWVISEGKWKNEITK